MDRLTKSQRRKNMQAVRSKGSKIEKKLAGALRISSVKFKKNVSKVFGKPDFIIVGKKIAIFCDSEFWHGKSWRIKKKEIKSNKSFWIKKIESNIKRDRLVNKTLKQLGWKVIRFWGKDISKNTEKCIKSIKRELRKK